MDNVVSDKTARASQFSRYLIRKMKAFSLAPVALLAMVLLESIARTAEANDAILAAYEKVSVALANDDLGTAKSAANSLAEIAVAAGNRTIADHAAKLSQGDSLFYARDEFRALSDEAIELAQEREGYHVMKCVMNGAMWVQPGERAINPYMGKKMQECGVMMDGTASSQ